jgi:hypothetical protein
MHSEAFLYGYGLPPVHQLYWIKAYLDCNMQRDSQMKGTANTVLRSGII